MTLTTYLWINVFISGTLALIWAKSNWFNFLIKVGFFANSIGGVYFLLK